MLVGSLLARLLSGRRRLRRLRAGYGLAKKAFIQLGEFQGLLFRLFKGGFRVSSGTSAWHMSSYESDFDNSEIASPVTPSLQ